MALTGKFHTDAIDGHLARAYKATSILGAKLDSIGDDLTVLAAVIGLFVIEFEFIRENLALILILFGLFFIALMTAIIAAALTEQMITKRASFIIVVMGSLVITTRLDRPRPWPQRRTISGWRLQNPEACPRCWR